MPEDRPKPDRPWREIAEEVATEGDSDKVIELSQELLHALDNETTRHREQMGMRDKELIRRKSA